MDDGALTKMKIPIRLKYLLGEKKITSPVTENLLRNALWVMPARRSGTPPENEMQIINSNLLITVMKKQRLRVKRIERQVGFA